MERLAITDLWGLTQIFLHKRIRFAVTEVQLEFGTAENLSSLECSVKLSVWFVISNEYD